MTSKSFKAKMWAISSDTHQLGVIQVLRNADGGWGVSDFLEKALRRGNVQCY